MGRDHAEVLLPAASSLHGCLGPSPRIPRSHVVSLVVHQDLLCRPRLLRLLGHEGASYHQGQGPRRLPVKTKRAETFGSPECFSLTLPEIQSLRDYFKTWFRADNFFAQMRAAASVWKACK